MAESAIVSAQPAVAANDGGLPRIHRRARHRRPGRLVRLFARVTGQCGHHWHATGGSVTDWHCCHCTANRAELPAFNGRRCSRPRLDVA